MLIVDEDGDPVHADVTNLIGTDDETALRWLKARPPCCPGHTAAGIDQVASTVGT